MTRSEKIQVLEDVAADLGVGGMPRSNYSGRGMYGKTCYGITTDVPDEVIKSAAAEGVRGGKVDRMGKHYWIVYWPSIEGDS